MLPLAPLRRRQPRPCVCPSRGLTVVVVVAAGVSAAAGVFPSRALPFFEVQCVPSNSFDPEPAKSHYGLPAHTRIDHPSPAPFLGEKEWIVSVCCCCPFFLSLFAAADVGELLLPPLLGKMHFAAVFVADVASLELPFPRAAAPVFALLPAASDGTLTLTIDEAVVASFFSVFTETAARDELICGE